MKSIIVNYDKEKDAIELRDDATEEDWVEVCGKFNDDVHKIRTLSDLGDYNRLYECYDDDNKSVFYAVEEDAELYKLRRKNVYKKLGLD